VLNKGYVQPSVAEVIHRLGVRVSGLFFEFLFSGFVSRVMGLCFGSGSSYLSACLFVCFSVFIPRLLFPVFGAQALGSRITGFGFRVSGFGFRVSGFGFRASDVGSGPGLGSQITGLGFEVPDFGFGISGFGFQVWGFIFWVSGSWFRVSGFRVRAVDIGSRPGDKHVLNVHLLVPHR